MKCENCGIHEANIKYTQIINGEKKQMFLCEECSQKLGINDIHFNMPINFTSFLTDFFDDMNELSFMPTLGEPQNILKCNTCGLTWDNFLHTGKFGCSNCYTNFENRIDPILRGIQGATNHVGRLGNVKQGNEIKETIEVKPEEENSKMSDLDRLKEDLKQAIKDERYEEAAKMRDEIKKLEK